jgi:hypothetical protein
VPEALSWIGMRIDDAYGARVGAVHDVYLEADGSPRWIFTLRRRVLIPGWDAIAGAGRVWVPYQRELIASAPKLWSLDDLTSAFETETRRWYAAGKDHSGWAAHVRSERSSR